MGLLNNPRYAVNQRDREAASGFIALGNVLDNPAAPIYHCIRING